MVKGQPKYSCMQTDHHNFVLDSYTIRNRPFNTSNPYFLLPVSGKHMKRFLRFRLSCHHFQLRQADIIDHLFLDHLDFAHIVP